MTGLAELLKGIGSLGNLAWPLVVLWIFWRYKDDMADVLKRIKKLKLLDQEVEIGEALERLQTIAVRAEEIGEQVGEQIKYKIHKYVNGIAESDAGRAQEDKVDELAEKIFLKPGLPPKAGLILLAGEIEKTFRQVVAATGHEELARLPMRLAFDRLQRQYSLPSELAGVVASFWDVRNKIVHNTGASDEDALRAIDLGLTILRALRSIPHEKNEVYHTGVPIYADESCANQRPDIEGLILKTTSPDGNSTNFRIFPTVKTDYQKGWRVSWAWDMSRVIGPSWYKDPDTKEIKSAWHQSAVFAGQNLDHV